MQERRDGEEGVEREEREGEERREKGEREVEGNNEWVLRFSASTLTTSPPMHSPSLSALSFMETTSDPDPTSLIASAPTCSPLISYIGWGEGGGKEGARGRGSKVHTCTSSSEAQALASWGGSQGVQLAIFTKGKWSRKHISVYDPQVNTSHGSYLIPA